MSDHMDNHKKDKSAVLKRVLAWVAIVLLVGMYVLTFLCSLMDSPFARQMFHASLYCTVIIPILLWVFIMTINMVKGKGEDEQNS